MLLKSRKKDIRLYQEWLMENAIHMDGYDGMTADVEKLSILDDKLSGRRIAYLVEMNHFIHEKYDFRLYFIRYLVSRGFRVICEELSWSDGHRINEYIQTGDENWLNRVTSYGYKGCVRTNRKDEPTGILKSSAETYPNDEFRAEQIRFAKSLRQINEILPQENRLMYFGFDADYTPGGAYEDTETFLEPFRWDERIENLRKCLDRVSGETIDEEINRLNHGLNLIDENDSHFIGFWGENIFHRIHRALETLKCSFEYIRRAHQAESYEALNPAMAIRERLMHDHLNYIVNRAASGEKIILMAGSLHLMKNDTMIQMADSGAGPGGKEVPSIGHYVNHSLTPGNVFSAWMLYDRGSDNQPFPGLPRKLKSPPDSLNAVMVAAGNTYVVPVTDDQGNPFFDRELNVIHMYNLEFKTVVSHQADAILFVKEVTPIGTHVHI